MLIKIILDRAYHSPSHITSQPVTGPLKLSVIFKYCNSLQSNSKMSR